MRFVRRCRSTSASISYIATGGNLGFSGGMNVGIREALARGADRVLLVNSDVDRAARLRRSVSSAASTRRPAPESQGR